MEIVLKRIAKRKSYTIGKLYVQEQAPSAPSLISPKGEKNQAAGGQAETAAGGQAETKPLPLGGGWEGAPYFCDTLEPPTLEQKTTVSKAAVLRSPRKAAALKPFAIPEGRYPLVVSWSTTFRRWLPLLRGVPCFEGVRIHAGNTPQDTRGCILLGDNRIPGQVLDSRRHVARLLRLLARRPMGEAVFITIE